MSSTSSVGTSNQCGNIGSAKGPSPKRARISWFLKPYKISNDYELTLMYRNSKNIVAPYSKSAQNSPVKVPWGTPMKCEFQISRDKSGKSVGEFVFVNRKKQDVICGESSLYGFDGGRNRFQKRVVSLIVDGKQTLLSLYLSLLTHSSGFPHHCMGIHSSEGFIIEKEHEIKEEINRLGGSLASYIEFIEIVHEVAEDLSENGSSQQSITSYFLPKRGCDDTTRGNATKKSKAAVVRDLEERELSDEAGIEKEYQNNMFGFANIPLKNLVISETAGVEVNQLRVSRIIDSIKTRYDPSLSIPVVCPTEGNIVTNIQDVKSQMLLVVQKVHTVHAFKNLDEKGEFTKLKGHGNGTLPCFVLKQWSLKLNLYGNLRSNFIENDFTRKFKPQDLLTVFDSLSKKKNPEESLEVIERMGRLFRMGSNEMTAVRKLCKWKSEAFAALMAVKSMFEKYSTLDVDESKKGFQMEIKRGERMPMTNSMLKMLGNVQDQYFLDNHSDILTSKISLKSFVEGFQKVKSMEKVTSVLSVIANESVDIISQKYPDRFTTEDLSKFIGADIVSGVKNDQAVSLEAYFKMVRDDAFPNNSGQIPRIVSFDSLNSLLTEFEHFRNYDVIVFRMSSSSSDQCEKMTRDCIMSDSVFIVRVFLYPNRLVHAEALSRIQNCADSKFKIIPLYFNTTPVVRGDVCENIEFSILIGKFSSAGLPISVYQNSAMNMKNILLNISPPSCKMAMIADSGCALFPIHSQNGKASVVDYFGSPSEVTRFQKQLASTNNSGNEVIFTAPVTAMEKVVIPSSDPCSTTSPFKTAPPRVSNENAQSDILRFSLDDCSDDDCNTCFLESSAHG